MPTRKQRRRSQKERRHEYETVWVDPETGEEVEEPDEVVDATRAKRDDGKPKPKAQQQRGGGRATRVPPAPSWRRAARRSLIMGVVIFVLFYLIGSKNGSNRFPQALEIAVLYTVLFIPFTYYVDRFAYNRFQRRAEQGGAKKR